MTYPQMSISEAAQNLTAFLAFELVKGEMPKQQQEQLATDASNQIAYATAQGVAVDTPRQVYEAVGWLSVQIESWLHDSELEDEVLERWATRVFDEKGVSVGA